MSFKGKWKGDWEEKSGDSVTKLGYNPEVNLGAGASKGRLREGECVCVCVCGVLKVGLVVSVEKAR